MPETQPAGSLQRGSLIKVLPGYRHETAGLHVVYPNRKQMPRSLAAFLEMVIARAAQADRD